jgi:sigma-B regulation protein RsbU (phosphoserine phosphatase)
MTAIATPSSPAPVPGRKPVSTCGSPLETLSCLMDTVEDLNSAVDLSTGLEQVADRLRVGLSFDTFAVLLLDELGRDLSFHFAMGVPPEVVENWRFGLGQGLVGIAAASGEAQVVGDVTTDPRYIRVVEKVRAEAAIPLVVKERVIGVLDIGSFLPDFFLDDLRELTFIAGHLAAAIERHRLYANLRRQTQMLSALHEASRELTSILDREQLLSRVSELVRRHMDFSRLNVFLWNEARQLLEITHSLRSDGSHHSDETLPLGRGLCGTAAALRQAVRVANVALDPRYECCSVGGVPIRSELAVPLVFKDRLVGVLDLESEEYNAFCEEDEQLLMTLASYLAIALENATLYKRLRDDEKRMAADLDTARTIQSYLLPKQTPWTPGLQIAAAYSPARHLGGDFYDVFSCGQHTFFTVGDVAGKGTAAALYASLVLGMLRGYAADACIDPLKALAYLNEELHSLHVDRRFVAAGVAAYEPEGRILRLANAGIPYPLLARDGQVREIVLPGVPIGALATAEYQEERLELRDGDVVVLASDGITEFRDGDGEPFGDERLAATLNELASGSANEIANGLLEATSRYAEEGGEPSDDRTVVALKVTESENSSS